jgi:lipopolysaccharide/colanic/teichoic acid biosynthesis glycosyltransferase
MIKRLFDLLLNLVAALFLVLPILVVAIVIRLVIPPFLTSMQSRGFENLQVF